jgi:hypothetical protein
MAITLYLNSVGVTNINPPNWGYVSEFHFPCIFNAKATDGSLFFFYSPLSVTDEYVVCKDWEMLIPYSQKSAMDTLVRNTSRGFTAYLGLGDLPNGLYPFGLYQNPPTHLFGITILSIEQTANQQSPKNYFSYKTSFVSPQSFWDSSSANIGQGHFSLSFPGTTCSNLPYPDAGFDLSFSYSQSNSLLNTGVVTTIDGGYTSDSFEVTCELLCNAGNYYNLHAFIAAYLTKCISSGPTTMTMRGYDIFGADAAVGHTVQFLGSEKSEKEIVLKATHVSYNRWKIPLMFKIVS